ncbi:hypothetical protein NUU61_007369 [Penicillium alfredii]|uniref:Uncharacterized protein n=1 Tax=Penicillium alfredii TaxID=1506179 RepID=A0A9W9F2R0_9EURO|nr:uncharacterized protein NUU61_007369 [Penicillium alfredii]KAJ5092499.1 hypothetical protein NUU61_007369 [Penicillium alfredii]
MVVDKPPATPPEASSKSRLMLAPGHQHRIENSAHGRPGVRRRNADNVDPVTSTVDALCSVTSLVRTRSVLVLAATQVKTTIRYRRHMAYGHALTRDLVVRGLVD